MKPLFYMQLELIGPNKIKISKIVFILFFVIVLNKIDQIDFMQILEKCKFICLTPRFYVLDYINIYISTKLCYLYPQNIEISPIFYSALATLENIHIHILSYKSYIYLVLLSIESIVIYIVKYLSCTFGL